MINFLKNLTVNFLFTLLPLFIFTGLADLISDFSVFSLTTRMILGGVFVNTFLMLPAVYIVKYIIKSISAGSVSAPSPSTSGGGVIERGSRNPRRDKDPYNFWIGIGFWCFFALVPIGLYLWLIFAFIQDLLK